MENHKSCNDCFYIKRLIKENPELMKSVIYLANAPCLSRIKRNIPAKETDKYVKINTADIKMYDVVALTGSDLVGKVHGWNRYGYWVQSHQASGGWGLVFFPKELTVNITEEKE